MYLKRYYNLFKNRFFNHPTIGYNNLTMRNILQKITISALMLFVLHIALVAQLVGSKIKIGTDSQISYWNGIDSWLPVAPGLPGQALQFTAGIPSWIPNPLGITTNVITSITGTTAVSGGNIITEGGVTITARGVCWSTSPNPTIALTTKTTNGTGYGSFSSNLSGLSSATTFFVRAYATNSVGTVYGNEVSFTTAAPPVTILTDYDGNIYDTVLIGTQVWMKQNLKTTHYLNGDEIPNITVNSNWGTTLTGAYSDYNNIAANSSTYGRLYNFYAVADARNLCPNGWHVPSDAEWITLTDYLGGFTIAGGKLKEAGLTHWISLNDGATNETGFTALPAGYHANYGTYGGLGTLNYFWSSTEYDATYVWARFLFNYDTKVNRSYYAKNHEYSVRCIKN